MKCLDLSSIKKNISKQHQINYNNEFPHRYKILQNIKDLNDFKSIKQILLNNTVLKWIIIKQIKLTSGKLKYIIIQTSIA